MLIQQLLLQEDNNLEWYNKGKNEVGLSMAAMNYRKSLSYLNFAYLSTEIVIQNIN